MYIILVFFVLFLVLIIPCFIVHSGKKIEKTEIKASHIDTSKKPERKEGVWDSMATDVEKALYILSTPQEVEFEAPREVEDKVKNYIRRMKRWVIGQDEALESIAQILYRRSAFKRQKGPLAVLLFLGPRGVGKTAAAKAIADALFGSPRASFVLDLADPFFPPVSLSELIDKILSLASKGVIIVESLEKHPESVKEAINFILKKGESTIKEWVLVLITSELSEYYEKEIKPYLKEVPSEVLSRKMREALISKGILWDELSDIVDKTVLFKKLDDRSLLTLGVKHLREMSEAYGLNVAGITPEALAHLVRISRDSAWGARTLLGYIYSVILEKLLIFKEEGLWIDVEEGQLVLKSRGKILQESEV